MLFVEDQDGGDLPSGEADEEVLTKAEEGVVPAFL